MNAGRQAIVERALLEQRRHGAAHRHDAGAEHHGGLLGQDAVGDLYRRLRAGLVVVEDELERLAVDAAFLVGELLEQLQRLLLALAEEGGAARQRQDDVDLVRIGRARAEQSERQHACRQRDGAIEHFRNRHRLLPGSVLLWFFCRSHPAGRSART
jgi:hypothetical protein